MKRRNTEDATDSLDTFLDTVCCLFGIIIFIAIMIAILAQLTTKEVLVKEIESESNLDEAVVQLEKRKTILETSLASYRESESLSNLRKLDDGEARLETLVLELERRKNILKAYKSALNSGASEIQALIDSIPETENEIEGLLERKKARLLLTNRPLRTPQRTLVDTFPSTFALVNGKLYEINPWNMSPGRSFEDNGGWCAMMSKWNTDDVDPNLSNAVSNCFGNTGLSSRRIKLKDDGGLEIGLDRPLLEDPAFKALIKRYNPKRQMVYFTVATDSFQEFGMVRAAFSEMRFRYDIDFADEGFKDQLVIDETWSVGKPSAQ